MIYHFFIIMLYLLKCISANATVRGLNNLRIVKAGDSVHFTCMCPKDSRFNAVWVKQRVGEKPLAIASFQPALSVRFENDFDKHKRISVEKDNVSFSLIISNVQQSDTATYYCAKFKFKFSFEEGTDLIVKAVLQRPVIDPIYQENSALALQCEVLTESCAGDQNIYWFRHASEESPPGIIYTQESRNGQCRRSSEGNSTEQKCTYSLPKNKDSDYDAGVYYCAVATCGEILFGDGRKPDLPDKGFQTSWSITAIVLAISNTLSVIAVIILGTLLNKHRQKDEIHNTQTGQVMVEDNNALNYAALSFQQKPFTSRRSREKKSQDNSVYAHVRHEFN